MDAEFWLQRWQDSQIGFHQADTEPLLRKHWPSIRAAANSAVFVPLCGKSLDMVWLAGQGHRIIGSELSPIAVDDFFRNLELQPEVRETAGFTVKSAGPYEIWCGDFFALPPETTADVGAVYDRAALIALPPTMRQRYADVLAKLCPATAASLLITIEYDQSILEGPPHSVLPQEVRRIFAPNWQAREIDREETPALSPKFKQHGIETVGQAVYHLVPAAADP